MSKVSLLCANGSTGFLGRSCRGPRRAKRPDRWFDSTRAQNSHQKLFFVKLLCKLAKIGITQNSKPTI
jgi:hypothetical protein